MQAKGEFEVTRIPQEELEIGEGATIGAGSTLTKDAPDGRLTVARARQVTLDGWRRPVKTPKP